MKRALAILLTVVAVGYVGWLAWVDADAVSGVWRTMNPVAAVWSCVVLMAAMFPLAFAVFVNLRMLGAPVTLPEATHAYFASQLGKYVPGKVWLFVIRARIYARSGVPNTSVAFSLAVEVLLGTAGALLALLLVLPGLQPGLVKVHPALVVAGVAALLVACSPPILNRVVARLQHGRNVVPVGLTHVATVLACYVVAWLGVGFAFLLLARSAIVLPWAFFPNAAAAFALGLVAGYFVFLAPAGIGIREFVLTSTLTPFLGPGPAAGLALVARIWWTVAELACILLAALWYDRRRTSTVKHDMGAARA